MPLSIIFHTNSIVLTMIVPIFLMYTHRTSQNQHAFESFLCFEIRLFTTFNDVIALPE